jgi:hypothetical protein
MLPHDRVPDHRTSGRLSHATDPVSSRGLDPGESGSPRSRRSGRERGCALRAPSEAAAAGQDIHVRRRQHAPSRAELQSELRCVAVHGVCGDGARRQHRLPGRGVRECHLRDCRYLGRHRLRRTKRDSRRHQSGLCDLDQLCQRAELPQRRRIRNVACPRERNRIARYTDYSELEACQIETIGKQRAGRGGGASRTRIPRTCSELRPTTTSHRGRTGSLRLPFLVGGSVSSPACTPPNILPLLCKGSFRGDGPGYTPCGSPRRADHCGQVKTAF